MLGRDEYGLSNEKERVMIFLMPIYAVIALIIIRLIMKKNPARYKWLQFVLLCFMFYLPVGWDVILGRAYFSYACHKDGGIHIYETVELGPENWNEDGSPKFYNYKGNFDEEYFDGKYSQIFVFPDKKFSSMLPVLRDVVKIIDTSKGNILGEDVSYLYTSGWVINTWQPFSVAGERCPIFSEYTDNPKINNGSPQSYRKFTSYVFLR